MMRQKTWFWVQLGCPLPEQALCLSHPRLCGTGAEGCTWCHLYVKPTSAQRPLLLVDIWNICINSLMYSWIQKEILLCCINWFISLCKNLFNLLKLTVTVKHWKWCTWHRKASAKNLSKLNKFLHSEVNQLIQHIIVRDFIVKQKNGKRKGNLFIFYIWTKGWRK